MARPRARPFRWIDVVLLAVFVALGVNLAVETEWEYVSRNAYGLKSVNRIPRVPGWLIELKVNAARIIRPGVAILAGLGVGLTVVTLRPRHREVRGGGMAPGHVASVLSGCFTLASVACWFLQWGLSVLASSQLPPSPTPPYTFGLFSSFLVRWEGLLNPQIPWMILGAWGTLAATGRWRRPVDAGDRLGRWLGAGWLVIALCQGVLHVIAWWALGRP
jgi:hypothetical protein